MQVTIEAIEQKVMLGGGQEMVTSVCIKLPDGSQFTAPVDPQVAEHLIRLANGSVPIPPPPVEELTEDDADVFGGTESPPEEEQVIDWTTLPDETLSFQMKKHLIDAGAPLVMKASELVALVDEISERMMAQAAEKAKAASPGRVQRMQVPRPRTVPKDELGYPIVPQQQTDRDPGEVALMGSDEDGVPQL